MRLGRPGFCIISELCTFWRALVQVRNEAGGIVQLVYGEDGLDPVGMEARDGGPVDFSRTAQVVCAIARRPPGGAPPPRSLTSERLWTSSSAFRLV